MSDFEKLDIRADPDVQFIGIQFVGRHFIDEFLTIECPCGVKAYFPLNSIPEVDTPHPCGNPLHWSLQYLPEPTP